MPNVKWNMDWLSLLQHHCGPTHLLDFTKPIYMHCFWR
ncbi:FRG domain-containing protein [uncultured Ruegeria sp.]